MEFKALFNTVEKEDLEKTKRLLEKLGEIDLSLIVNDLQHSPLMVSTLKNNLSINSTLIRIWIQPKSKRHHRIISLYCFSGERVL